MVAYVCSRSQADLDSGGSSLDLSSIQVDGGAAERLRSFQSGGAVAEGEGVTIGVLLSHVLATPSVGVHAADEGDGWLARIGDVSGGYAGA